VIPCTKIYEALWSAGVRFFAGVPDSLLKHFCACVSDLAPAGRHVIAANEGAAVALVAGHYLATGTLGAVYLQNSGQGNAVNPLISLADAEVYAIPLLLVIGWRGQPEVADEPQHVKQGKITLSLLDTMGIPHAVLPKEPGPAVDAVDKAAAAAKRASAPYALVVERDTFVAYERRCAQRNAYTLTREEAIAAIVAELRPDDAVVATTGKASRELYELRAASTERVGRDFLTVGSMGHASQIALGVALAQPDRTVYCIDGDGAVIMHMGAMATIGALGPPNFRHVVLNNGAHDSVGGQPTVGFDIDLVEIADACGYRQAARAETRKELVSKHREGRSRPGPTLLEVRVRRGARPDLGRPSATPQQNKRVFMDFLRS